MHPLIGVCQCPFLERKKIILVLPTGCLTITYPSLKRHYFISDHLMEKLKSLKIRKNFASFKHVRVIWFFLMVSILSDQQVDVNWIDNLGKGFLLACRHFWSCTQDMITGDEDIQFYCSMCQANKDGTQKMSNKRNMSMDKPPTESKQPKVRKNSEGKR